MIPDNNPPPRHYNHEDPLLTLYTEVRAIWSFTKYICLSPVTLISSVCPYFIYNQVLWRIGIEQIQLIWPYIGLAPFFFLFYFSNRGKSNFILHTPDLLKWLYIQQAPVGGWLWDFMKCLNEMAINVWNGCYSCLRSNLKKHWFFTWEFWKKNIKETWKGVLWH